MRLQICNTWPALEKTMSDEDLLAKYHGNVAVVDELIKMKETSLVSCSTF